MRPFKISIHNRKGVGLEFDFEEGHLLVRLLNAMAATLNDPSIPDECLDRVINDMVYSFHQKFGHHPNVQKRKVPRHDDQTWNQN